MSVFDPLPRPSADLKRNARRRILAARYAKVKLSWLNAGLQVAETIRYRRVMERFFDKLLAGAWELQELERRFPNLLDPHPDVLYAGLEKTKRIRLEQLEQRENPN